MVFSNFQTEKTFRVCPKLYGIVGLPIKLKKLFEFADLCFREIGDLRKIVLRDFLFRGLSDPTRIRDGSDRGGEMKSFTIKEARDYFETHRDEFTTYNAKSALSAMEKAGFEILDEESIEAACEGWLVEPQRRTGKLFSEATITHYRARLHKLLLHMRGGKTASQKGRRRKTRQMHLGNSRPGVRRTVMELRPDMPIVVETLWNMTEQEVQTYLLLLAAASPELHRRLRPLLGG